MGVLQWVLKHWLDLLQSIGIVCSLLFTGLTLKTDARVRRVQNLLKITEQHRNLWSRLYDNPELGRVTDPNPDLENIPVTRQEELFVLLLVLHLNSAYQAIRHGMFSAPDRLSEDIRQFFSKPIPTTVWQQLKNFQDRDFVTYIEENST